MHRRPLLAAAALSIFIAGCGSGGGSRLGQSATGLDSPAFATTTATLRTATSVIRRWSDALRRGDINLAASYFALPSQFADGLTSNGEMPVATIRTVGQARLVNTLLPCGARFVSATRSGRYVQAQFVLTGRPGPGGTNCGGGAGARASTDFVIRDGKIVVWLRAPNPVGPRRRSTPPIQITTTPQIVD